jgi:hypothetical protein
MSWEARRREGSSEVLAKVNASPARGSGGQLAEATLFLQVFIFKVVRQVNKFKRTFVLRKLFVGDVYAHLRQGNMQEFGYLLCCAVFSLCAEIIFCSSEIKGGRSVVSG